MKFLLVLSIALLAFFQDAVSQVINVVDANNVPVSQAVVSFKNLETKANTVFLTDNFGRAQVPAFNDRMQIFISHVAFLDYTDTLINGVDFPIVKLTKKNIPLQEVIVTSEYGPVAMEESIHKATVITRENIENQGASSLDGVLANLLNVRINQDQILGSGITMNGLSGQNIKYLVDGVPVIGRLDGNIDLSQITLHNVERIEIINGPMAASYGTDAIGGVINVITRQPGTRKYQVGLNLKYEDIGHYNADGYSGFSTGKTSVMAGGGRNFFDGWSATDTSRWQEWKPKEQIFGNVKFRWTGKKSVFGYQLSAFHEKISNKGVPRVSPYFAYAFDEYYKTMRYTNQATFSYMLNRDYNIASSFSWSLYNRHKNTYRKDLVSLSENLVKGSEEQDTTIMNAYASRATFSFSKPEARFRYQGGYDITYETAGGTRFENDNKVAGDFAVFASGEYKASPKLEVRPAIRISYNTTYKAPVIPSLSFKYDFTPAFTGRLSYGKGFRAPGLKERYLYFVDINHNIRGNENLLPEYSDNFFAAVNYTFKMGKVSNQSELNAFHNDIRNMITLAQPDPYSTLFTYVNLGTFSTHGVSLKHNATWNALTLGAGVSYTGRYNIYSDSGDFKKFIYSADFNAMAQYSFTKINLTTSVYFKFNGKLPGYRLNPDNTITQFSNDSYRFLDAIIRKGFFRNRIYAAVGMKNILNVTTINAVTEGSAHSAGSDEQAIGTGRSLFVKLQYAFSK